MSLRIEDFGLNAAKTMPAKKKKLNNKNIVNNDQHLHKGKVILYSYTVFSR